MLAGLTSSTHLSLGYHAPSSNNLYKQPMRSTPQSQDQRVQSLMSEAFQLKQSNNLAESLRAFSQVIAIHNNDPIALEEMSKIHHLHGDNQLAMQEITQSISLLQTPDKYCLLADMQNDLTQHTKAIESYSKAVDLKDQSVTTDTKQFLEKSVVIKMLPQIKQTVERSIRILVVKELLPSELQAEVRCEEEVAQKKITQILKYGYDQLNEKAKGESILEYKGMIDAMMKKLQKLEGENLELRHNMENLYKNHEKIFLESLDSSTMSLENKEVIKMYFTTFCQKMELFYLSMKVLNKVPDSGLSFKDIALKLDDKEEAIVELQRRLASYCDYMDKAKGVIEQLPYLSLIYRLVTLVARHSVTSKYKQMHEQNKMRVVEQTWMNCQVFNDFVGNLAIRLTERMKLRIINHNEPSFKNYLQVLWIRAKRIYKHKNDRQKLKQLEHEQYNRRQYVGKLSERDAALVFYAFEVERLGRKMNPEDMVGDISKLIEEFEQIKVEDFEQLTPAKAEERRCLLF